MRSLKMQFSGEEGIAIDWGSEVSGLQNVAQQAVLTFTTRIGSDKVNPTRGTNVFRQLVGGVNYNYMAVQHVLNFGTIKTRRDLERSSEGKPDNEIPSTISATLLSVEGGTASAAIRITNAAGESTREITRITP